MTSVTKWPTGHNLSCLKLQSTDTKMKMKIALNLSQREIHTVAARAAQGDLGLKSHPKDKIFSNVPSVSYAENRIHDCIILVNKMLGDKNSHHFYKILNFHLDMKDNVQFIKYYEVSKS